MCKLYHYNVHIGARVVMDGWMDGGQLSFTGLLCAVLNSHFCSSAKGWKTNDCHEIDTKLIFVFTALK